MRPLPPPAAPPRARRLRRPLRLAGLGAALLASACGRSTGPEDGAATFTGRWANRPWAGSASATLAVGGAAGDTLYVGASAPPDAGQMPVQSIWLRVAPFRGAGTYAIAPDGGELVTLLGGDGVTNRYVGRRPTAGTLVVQAYDASARTVRGTVHFLAESASGSAPFGPQASFENGRFRASVYVYDPRAQGR